MGGSTPEQVDLGCIRKQAKQKQDSKLMSGSPLLVTVSTSASRFLFDLLSQIPSRMSCGSVSQINENKLVQVCVWLPKVWAGRVGLHLT